MDVSILRPDLLAVLKLVLLCINSSLTRIPTINYNVALNLINSQQLSQNYFLTAIAAKISKLRIHCSLLGKPSLTLKSCNQAKL
mgnify:CR=1 FL=1